MHRARVCIQHAVLGYALRCRFIKKRKSVIRIQKFLRLLFLKKALLYRIVKRKNHMEAVNKFAEGMLVF